MYEELVKRLREIVPWECLLTCMNAMHEAADAIDKQNVIISGLNETIKMYENETPQWIPVTERFPKFGVRVLCKCRANIYEVLKWTAEGWEYDPQHIYMSGFVTHWMPLPEPPKEGE